jgi:hypothetical protein
MARERKITTSDNIAAGAKAPAHARASQLIDFIGRVLRSDSTSAGVCFQVAAGVLVTSCQVLDDIGAATTNALVGVEPLAHGKTFAALVKHVNPVQDLAVMVAQGGLPATARSLVRTDQLPPGTSCVIVTTDARLVEGSQSRRFQTAHGEWAGGTTWDDAVPLGLLTLTTAVPGTRGAPVIRRSDGAVAGVVSGRLADTDGWPSGTVRVARTEDLVPLLTGIADVAFEEISSVQAVDLVLTVDEDMTRLAGPGINISAPHGGVRLGLTEAVEEVRRVRARRGSVSRSQLITQARAAQLSLARAGSMLASSFLPPPVASELRRVLQGARHVRAQVRLGLAVPQELAGLPWECMPDPLDRLPLALHPLISLYRQVEAGAPRGLPGPLRIVVAIAAPDDIRGGALDYESELRNLAAAVRSARQAAASVRVVQFATPEAIHAELAREPAHVLHISGHGHPGLLDLENDDGSVRQVSAQEFLEEAVPPGNMPPLIVLAACHTAVTAAEGGPSFAAELCQFGAAAVIGAEASVTDRYATRLLARLYGTLAQAEEPDVVAAFADARRAVQRELGESADKRDRSLAALDEWAVLTVLAGSGIRLFDPKVIIPVAAPPTRQRIAGLGLRDAGEFVGRRREQRYWHRDLIASPGAGLVICGVGGIGKTALAAEITGQTLNDDPLRVLVSFTGAVTIDGVLTAITSELRTALLARDQIDDQVKRALAVASRAELGWQHWLTVLREHLLGRVPLLVVLDNFDDNLQRAGTGHIVRDENLGSLLAMWIASPGRSRLLVTSRFAFTLPGDAQRGLSFRQIGPLSLAEAMKLAWSLPALDHLSRSQFDRVWRLVGGHPRSLEYLDALLSGGSAHYPDVEARLTAAVSARLASASLSEWAAARTCLDPAIAEVVSLAAADMLLDDLLTRLREIPGAEDLLLGASVYREPVGIAALLFQAGEADEVAVYDPDYQTAQDCITEILGDSGVAEGEALDEANLPPTIQALLTPHLEVLRRLPRPPFRARPGLPALLEACQRTTLVVVGDDPDESKYFVHRWTATQLARGASSSDDPGLRRAHRQAAKYWRWRFEVWPQDPSADMHDLLQARHHLFQAGDVEEALQLSEPICDQLHTLGAWDDELSLIQDTITRIPSQSPHRSAWMGQLGILAQARGADGQRTGGDWEVYSPLPR